MNIRQAFLHEAKDRKFHVAWQPSNVFLDIQFDLEAAALAQSLNVPLKRGGQARLVQ